MIRIKNAIGIFEKSNLQANDYSNEGIYPFYTSSQNLTKKCDVALFPEDSITMGTGGQASVNYSDVSFSTSTDCFNFQSIFGKDYTKFIYYYLLAHIDEINSLGFQGMGLKHLQKDFIYNLEFDENLISKEKISYLDCLSQRINALITNEEKQIEKLKAYKQALISEVVTKGLDPNAPMKDSNQYWFGEVSTEFEILKTLWCLEMPITDGPHETPVLVDEGVPFISAEAVSCGDGGIDFSHMRGYITWDYYEECSKKYIPQKDDIYMIKSGATTGRVSIVDTNEIFTIWSPLAVFRVNKNKVLPKYMYYFLQSSFYQKQVELKWTFGTQQNIGMRTLEQLLVLIPSMNKQIFLVAYLDHFCNKIKCIIKKKSKKIDALKQYRQSVIYEYVTGKRKVY